jgi:glutathione S-transferase
MKLYYSPGACSLSPHIVLRETGARFELEKVDFGSKKTASGADFTKVNPKGYVPALALDDGAVLTEGPAIVQYLADQAPKAGLLPAAGTLARARVQEWLNFITSELHKAFGPLFSDSTPADYKEQLKQRIAGRFDFLEKHLAGNAFLMGKDFTVADPYCFTVVGWNKYVGIDLDRWPALKAYQGRVAARPSVQAALKAEGLT